MNQSRIIVGIIGNLPLSGRCQGFRAIKFMQPFNLAAKSLARYFGDYNAADSNKLATNLSWGISFSMTYGEFDNLLIKTLIKRIYERPHNYIICDITKINQYYAIKRAFPDSIIIDIGLQNTDYIPHDLRIEPSKLSIYLKSLSSK